MHLAFHRTNMSSQASTRNQPVFLSAKKSRTQCMLSWKFECSTTTSYPSDKNKHTTRYLTYYRIPNRPEDKPLYPRCSQPPEKEMCGRTLLEVRALEALTLATCSCTPKYITSKHGNQVSDGWVPDGLLDYIVMQRVEGISLPRKYLRDLGPMEQDEIRKAFKTSYQWVIRILSFTWAYWLIWL